MSLITWQDEADAPLAGALGRAGAVATEPGLPLGASHFGSPAGELAACVHAVGLLVSGREQVTFELLGRRVAKVLRALAELRPELEWSRPGPERARVSVAADQAPRLWRELLEAGRPHGIANVGHDAAARHRLLVSRSR